MGHCSHFSFFRAVLRWGLTLTSLSCLQAAAGTVAFIVGQSNYSVLEKLPSATVDAEVVASALRKTGATVFFATDADAGKIAALATDFLTAARSADRVVVYFAGHSVNLDSGSMLVPVDPTPAEAIDLGSRGLYLNRLISEASSAQTVVFLDACWELRPAVPANGRREELPCASAAPYVGAQTVALSRGLSRQLPPASVGASAFGTMVAAALADPGLDDLVVLANDLQKKFYASTGKPLQLLSTFRSDADEPVPASTPPPVLQTAAQLPSPPAIALPAAPGLVPQAALLPAAAPPVMTRSEGLLPADIGARPVVGTPRASAVEAAVGILRQLEQLGLKQYIEVEMLIQGLQSGFDPNILPPRSESDLLLASKLVPSLVSSGVPASSELVLENMTAYSFQLGRQQALKFIESGRYRSLPDLQVFRETLSSPPADAFAASPMGGIGGSGATAPIRDLQMARIEGERFLSANGQRNGVSSLPTGLQYESLLAGTGRLPLRRNIVRMHLSISRVTGGVIQDTRRTGDPLETPINSLIKGLQEGLLLMREGGKMRFYIPSRLAYGDTGSGAVGPHEVVICDVELLEVVK